MNVMKEKITKAIIPAAGLGTRFLPATKTVPKEMLPLVDRPILLYIIEECAKAGIEDVILVSGRGKTAIEDFFDTSYELERVLEKSGKIELLESISRIKDLVNIVSIRQKEARGLGHAIATAAPITGNSPFAVLLGDEIMISSNNQPTAIEELCHSYARTGLSSVATMEVPENDVSKYGIIKCEPIDETSWRVLDVIEKPSPAEAPSRMALPGRYVFCPEIMAELKNTQPGVNGEIQMTDAMAHIAKNQGLIAKTVQAKRFDAGDKLGFLQANIELALARKSLGDDLKVYLKNLVQTF